jgi:hypothetical protein
MKHMRIVIAATETREGDGGPYTVYVVETTFEDGQTVCTPRRFAEFEALKGALDEIGCSASGHPFPSKTLFGTLSAQTVSERKVADRGATDRGFRGLT